MKVILNQTVPKVGKVGQVVNVADGFARNFLFPRNLAIVADKAQLAVLERRREKASAKLAEDKTSAEAMKEALDSQTVRLPAQVGKNTTKLFGAITAQDVVDAIKKQFGKEVDRKRVGLVEPIKRLGTFSIHLDLHHDVDAYINVEVFDPEAPVTETAPTPETE